MSDPAKLQAIGLVFRRKRDDLNLSLRDVEQRAGVGRTTVSNVETGRNLPDGMNLIRLMDFYGLSVKDLSLRR